MLKPWVRSSLLGAAAAALFLVPAPAQAAPAPVGGSGLPEAVAPIDMIGLDFQLINNLSRKCLAGPTATGALVQKDCGRTTPFRWRFAPETVDGTFHIVNVGTSKCLTALGDDVGVAPCDSRASRSWRLLDSVDPNAQVRNSETGRCLSVAGSGTAENDEVTQYTCDNKHLRRWTVRVLSIPFLG